MTEEEKLAEEYGQNYFKMYYPQDQERRGIEEAFFEGYKAGQEKLRDELMWNLKDEGIVKLFKDSIFYNERLSSQEQQELCSWLECAMDFGETLDECAKRIGAIQADEQRDC